MFSKKPFRWIGTLAFKLTIWYAAIFSVSCFCALVVFYLATASVIRDHTDLEMWKDAKEFSSIYGSKGMGELKAAMLTEMESEGVGNMFLRLVESGGEEFTLPEPLNSGAPEVGKASINRLSGGADHCLETLSVPGHPYRFRVLTYSVAPGLIMQMGQSLEDDERLIQACREVLGITMGLVVALSALGGFVFARRSLAGVEEVTRIANQISKGAFDRRVNVKGRGKEIDTLAEAFNRMLERIEALVKGMREMTDNSAHDLKSPITRIRGIAEATLIGGSSVSDSEFVFGGIVEECDRLLTMINAMLDISEAEAGVARLVLEEVDIAQVVQDAADLFQPIAENNQLHMEQKSRGNTVVHGDKSKIQRAVSNLLDNALKYTPPGGAITASVEGEPSQVVVYVSDTGQGISETDLPKVFDRFFRGDRSRSEPGSGLGLSLALAIAHAHGGDIKARSLPGKGSTFTMTLPRSPLVH